MISHAAFAVHSETADSIIVITLRGDLEFATAGLLRQALQDVFIGAGMLRIVIDLACLSFTDSTGIALIIRGYKQAQAYGGSLVLAAVPANIHSVLRVAGLTRLFSIYDTVAEACTVLAEGGASCRR